MTAKKLYPLIILALLLTTTLLAHAETAVDNYPTSNYSLNASLKAVHPTTTTSASAKSQAFTGNGMNLLSAIFYLYKTGSPAGYLKARVYNITGSYGTNAVPTGDPIETSTNAISMATLPTSSGISNQTFNFTGTTTLTNGAYYCIVIYVENATVINDSHYANVGIDNTSPSHGGNYGNYVSSAWAGSSTYDVIFYIYGELYYNLTSSADSGGTVDPTGTNSYIKDSEITVTATNSSGYTFANWAVTGIGNFTTNPLPLTMNQSYTVTAYFTADAPPTPTPIATWAPLPTTPPTYNILGNSVVPFLVIASIICLFWVLTSKIKDAL